MTEDVAVPTEYENLAAEFQRLSGPLDASLQYIQDGIEMEDFRQTRAGKVLIGRCMKAMHSALDMILDPNLPDHELVNAVRELRVQHRVLETIASTVDLGRKVTRRIEIEDLQEQENPDEQSL